MIPTHTDGEVLAPISRAFGGSDEEPTNSEESSAVAPLRKLLVTPEEAAEVLSIGRTTVYNLVGSGELGSVQIKSCRRIPVAALERFVQRLQDDS